MSLSPVKWLLICAVVLTTDLSAYGQAGLRQALERLDTNEDGYIERGEITPLARPYLERITRERRISLDGKSVEIHELQEAARIYYAIRNGADDDDIRYEGKASVRPFEPDNDQVLVPEFGLPEIRYPYTQANLRLANSILRRYDYNDDGFIDRREAARSRWTHNNPFEMDLNMDDRISRMELTQRYAKRDLVEDTFDELRQRARRVGNGIERSTKDEPEEDRSQWWRRGGSSYWLTASMIGRFDANKNGRLEVSEANSLGFPTTGIDQDGDGEIAREELHVYVSALQSEAGDVTAGLPAWFFELDTDRDGQIAMSEFTTEWSVEKRRKFASFDLNDDGFLTEQEMFRSAAAIGGDYTNKEALVLPPRRTIISEIEVTDDFLISDVNVEISITHSHVAHLDAYLTGPDGQRIELFTEVGSSGDHFDQTVFDDQAREAITKSKPPFEGRYLPEGLLKRQLGLSAFNGKNVKGVWQLVIRGSRSDRFGMLHNWGLTVKPYDELPGTRPTPAPEEPAEVERDERGKSSRE